MRAIVGKIHLWLGLGVGVIVFTVASTGALLVFEQELKPVLYPRIYQLSVGQTRLSTDSLLVHARCVANAPLQSVFRSRSPQWPALFRFGTDRYHRQTVAVNPYDGTIVAVSLEVETLFPLVRSVHRYLCLGKVGKIVTGVSCFVFVWVLVSGLVLRVLFRGRKKRKQHQSKGVSVHVRSAFPRMLHMCVGTICFPILICIGCTGMAFAFDWVKRMAYGKPLPVLAAHAGASPADPPRFERMFQSVDKATGGLPADVRVSVPQKHSHVYKVTHMHFHETIKRKSSLYYCNSRGDIVDSRPFAQMGLRTRAEMLNYAVHTGALFGTYSQVIWFFVAICTAALPVTGVLIWVGHLRAKKLTKRGGKR